MTKPAPAPALIAHRPSVIEAETIRSRRLALVLVGVMLAAFLVSLLIGPAGLTPSESIAALLGRDGPQAQAHLGLTPRLQ